MSMRKYLSILIALILALCLITGAAADTRDGTVAAAEETAGGSTQDDGAGDDPATTDPAANDPATDDPSGTDPDGTGTDDASTSGDAGADDGTGSGTDDGSGSGTDDGSGSGTDDGSGSGTDDGTGSGTDGGSGAGDGSGAGAGGSDTDSGSGSGGSTAGGGADDGEPDADAEADPADDEDAEADEGAFASLTTGRGVAEATGLIFAVSIDNDEGGRPQTAMSDADVVIEIPCGPDGATKYLALYADAFPEAVGSLRSLDPVMLTLARAWRAIPVFCGASGQDVYEQAQSGGEWFDALNGGAFFYRDTARVAPHNVMARLSQLAGSLTAAAPDNLPLLFGAEPSTADQQRAVFRARYSKENGYYPSYEYLAGEGVYRRYYNRHDYFDADGTQYTCTNVIFMQMPLIWDDGEVRLPDNVSSGACDFFIAGRQITGAWALDADGGLQFTDAAGEQIVFRPGKTFIQVIVDPAVIELAN